MWIRKGKGTLPSKCEKKGEYIFAHKDMVGRVNKNGRPWTNRTVCQYNVEQVLYVHNKWHATKNKTVSESRRSSRWTEVKAAFNDLHDLDYRIIYPQSITRRHVIALTRYWEEKGLLPSSVLQKYSTLCVFLKWIGKEHIFESLCKDDLYAEPERFVRIKAATEDKSWGKDNICERLARVENLDRHVADQLCLTMLFGLRAKESMLLRPRIDYKPEEKMIYLTRGTKGGRPREVPVETEEQKLFLEKLCESRIDKSSSMVPRMIPLKKWVNHYYRVLNKCGISRNDGFVPHGLRHGYSHVVYENITGYPAPVKHENTHKKIDIKPINDRIARRIISERLGHSRVSISSAYLGNNST